jgi:hypothetical protein
MSVPVVLLLADLDWNSDRSREQGLVCGRNLDLHSRKDMASRIQLEAALTEVQHLPT